MSYEESLKLLKNTSNVVELTVSQIFSEYQRKLQQQTHQQQQHMQSHHNQEMYDNTARIITPSITTNTAATADNIIYGNTMNENQIQLTKHLSPISRLTYANERNANDKTNDTDKICLQQQQQHQQQYDNCDNNNRDEDVTVLITKQRNRNAQSYLHCNNLHTLNAHDLNDMSNHSITECMPDLPKVNLQLS